MSNDNAKALNTLKTVNCITHNKGESLKKSHYSLCSSLNTVSYLVRFGGSIVN